MQGIYLNVDPIFYSFYAHTIAIFMRQLPKVANKKKAKATEKVRVKERDKKN